MKTMPIMRSILNGVNAIVGMVHLLYKIFIN